MNLEEFKQKLADLVSEARASEIGLEELNSEIMLQSMILVNELAVSSKENDGDDVEEADDEDLESDEDEDAEHGDDSEEE